MSEKSTPWSKYYDRQNQELELLQWAKLQSDVTYKFVRRTRVLNANDEPVAVVITIWDGHDYEPMFDEGPVRIFETTVFRRTLPNEKQDGLRLDAHNRNVIWIAHGFIEPRRYATEEQALAGHRELTELAELCFAGKAEVTA